LASEYDKWPAWKMTAARLVIATSQMVNTLLLGFPDETISGRCGRALKTGRAKEFAIYLSEVIDFFFETFFNETDHCFNAVKDYENFNQRPEVWRWHHG
jgi:hypothetical protein